MSERPPHRSPEDFDRDFAELVHGWELDQDVEPEPPTPVDPPDLSQHPAGGNRRRAGSGRPGDRSEGNRSEDNRRDVAASSPSSDDGWFNLGESLDKAEPDEPADWEWKPETSAMPALRTPAVAALTCLGAVVVVLVLTIFGVSLPRWVGWAAVALFVAGILTGWRALPRDHDPDDGDGAVV